MCPPRPTSPALSRASLAALLVVAVAFAPSRTQAAPSGSGGPALAEGDITRVLGEVLAHPRAPSAFARWLALLPALDGLAPAEARAWLGRFERLPDVPLMRARAAFEALAYEPGGSGGSGAPEVSGAALRLGFATRWLAVAARDPDGDLLARHRELLAADGARRGAPFDRDDPDRIWALAGGGPVAAIALDPIVARGASGVVHLATEVRVATATRATLRLGAAADALLVSVDGQPVGGARFLSGAVMDQLEVPLELAAGAHTILVTLVPSAREPLVVRARWTDAHGESDPVVAGATGAALEEIRWAHGTLTAEPPALGRHPLLRTLGASGSERPREGRAAAAHRRREAVWVPLAARLMGLADRTETGDLERALGAEADGTGGLDPASFVLALGGVARADVRTSLLGAWLAERSSGAGSGEGAGDAALASLAREAMQRGAFARAALLVEAITDPSLRVWVGAELGRYEGEPERGVLALAGETSARARALAADLALAIGRADEAVTILEALWAEVPGQLEYLQALGRAREAAGDVAGALAARARLAEARPDRLGYALGAIEKTLAAGQTERARAELTALVPRLAWKADALVTAGRLFERLGDKAAAASGYARALALEPAHDEARRRAERLAGGQALPLAAFDPPSLTRMASAPALDPRAAFEVLDESIRIDVAADGSATRWVRRILRTQNVPDAREARTFTMRFDPSREDLRVVSAAILRPEGREAGGTQDGASRASPGGWRVIPVAARELRSISESWYGLYYDVRELRVPFDGLERGDLLQITSRSDAIGNIFPGIFEFVHVLDAPIPNHAVHIVVEAPAEIALHERLTVSEADRARVATRHTTATNAAGRPVERWSLEARQLAALAHEHHAPGGSEVAPVWQLTSFASWEALGAWYRRLLAQERVVTDAMRAFIATARRSATQRDGTVSESALVLAIARYVTRDIRYVGLEFGVHGYKPYRTDQVWARRFGDCKDKALLLTTLLEEAGVRAEVALVRSRPSGRIGLDGTGPSPSLALFDHAIVYLPDRGLYVDPTATHHEVGELPREDQGAQALLVPREGPARFVVTPVDPPTRNGIVGVYSVALGPNGAGQIQATVAFQGLRAPFYRALFADASRQKTALEQVLNGRYPGLKLESFRPGGGLGGPVELVFHASVPALASVNGKALVVPHPAGLDGVVDAVTGLETRKTPLVLGPPALWSLTFRYELPGHMRVGELPRSDSGEGPFGKWSVAWSEEPGAVVVTAELAWHVDQIAPGDYPAFRQFARTIDAALPDALVIESEAP